MKNNIDKSKVLDRLSDIERAVQELNRFREHDLQTFDEDKDNYPVAAYWIRVAIEAVLTIGTHILSRLPSNGMKKDYTEVIFSLGNYGVVPKEFARSIKGMAGYRNRLIHLYWKIGSEELLGMIQEHLDDFVTFNHYIRDYLKKINEEG
jgi:uncharacterized protein YutE (UPF0331/DUF86 family)